MGENTVVPYVSQKSKKTLDQEIYCNISPEVLKTTVSYFMYYRTKMMVLCVISNSGRQTSGQTEPKTD